MELRKRGDKKPEWVNDEKRDGRWKMGDEGKKIHSREEQKLYKKWQELMLMFQNKYYFSIWNRRQSSREESISWMLFIRQNENAV